MKFVHRSADVAIALVLLGLVLGTIVATAPFADVPRNDDFAYARAAQVLATEGRIEFKMTNAMALPQLAYGALVIRQWGFSYYILDLTGIIAAALAAMAIYFLARACGCSSLSSCLATAALTLNPIFLAIAPSFMTDLPGLLFLLLSLLVLVKSLATDSAGEVIVDKRMLILSALLGFLAGAQRQVNWVALLGALAMLFVLLPRQRRLAGPVALALFAGAALLTIWFGQQPHTSPINAREGIKDLIMYRQIMFNVIIYYYFYLVFCGIFLLPVTISVLGGWRRFQCWYAIVLALLLSFPRLCLPDFRLPPAGQYFTSTGVYGPWVHGFESRPPMLPAVVVGGLIILGAMGATCFAYLLIQYWREIAHGQGRPTAVPEVAACLLLSASLAQIPAMVPWVMRGSLFDRYLLAFLPGLLIFAGSRFVKSKLSIALSIGLLSMYWFVGFAVAAEYAAYTRARAALFEHLLVQGIPRNEIDGGYEFSGDTQLLGARQLFLPPGSTGKHVSFAPQAFPVLDARYRLSTEADPDSRIVYRVPVASVAYRSLLAPKNRIMYIYKIIKD